MDIEAIRVYGEELRKISENGLLKEERIITGPQGACIDTTEKTGVLNMCSNNYLGLANHPEVIAAAKKGLEKWGYGLSSVRFICGTQEIHKELERKLSEFLCTDDSILYSSCFDANGGVFEVLLSDRDAVISDELNHASIIDGVRLCKAARYRYKNNDIDDLESKLKESQDSRIRLIVTDGVFSMDGFVANLKEICDLADKYHSLVMVDDSHAVGFMGENGRGTHEYCGVIGRVDIITGTLGKALGGASGGYVSGRREIVSLLRQRSRPYLFSNTLAPSIAEASVKALDIITRSAELRETLFKNTRFYRDSLKRAGFTIPEGIHPIVPIILGDAVIAQKMSRELMNKGIYATAFSYPVVPLNKARIRTQVSAAHSQEDLARVVDALSEIGKNITSLNNPVSSL